MEEVFPDWYTIMGLRLMQPLTEIRKAFRAGARQFHPDVNKSPAATAHFIKLQKVYWLCPGIFFWQTHPRRVFFFDCGPGNIRISTACLGIM